MAATAHSWLLPSRAGAHLASSTPNEEANPHAAGRRPSSACAPARMAAASSVAAESWASTLLLLPGEQRRDSGCSRLPARLFVRRGQGKPTCRCNRPCGSACCKPGEKCGSARRSVCCKTSETPCLTKTTATCCSRREKCCEGVCCTPNQICRKGAPANASRDFARAAEIAAIPRATSAVRAAPQASIAFAGPVSAAGRRPALRAGSAAARARGVRSQWAEMLWRYPV